MSASTWAQEPTIISMIEGQLTFSGINPNHEYQVEWASRLSDSNAFRSGFSSVEYISPTNTVAMTVDIPQFYRISSRLAPPHDVVRASDEPLVINATTNNQYTLEWAEDPDGPWNSNWNLEQELTCTGSVITIPSPKYYRITYLNP
ncbi:MAG TPA: hypothetical protein DCZ95_16570 [Verrucomicrobia bacterium]|nr:MAG: hypothetical protein A2X46_14695 [Lentisphaerae bacterium GWF2_57_35]HBA85697.1 hypothetical protein [Verrucomicrobiota bacterium]